MHVRMMDRKGERLGAGGLLRSLKEVDAGKCVIAGPCGHWTLGSGTHVKAVSSGHVGGSLS